MERPSGPAIVVGSSKSSKQEWDARVDRGTATKQELPQQPIISTMNGSSVKSSLRHIRLGLRRQPPISAARALKNAMLQNPHVVPKSAGKEKEKGREKDKENDSGEKRFKDSEKENGNKRNQLEWKHGEESEILDTFIAIPTTTTHSFHLSATNTTQLSQLSSNNSNNNSEYNTKMLSCSDKCQKNVFGIECTHDEKSNSGIFDKSGKSELSSPFRGLKKCRLSSLKIDVSLSTQTLDKDDDEMRKEINEISNLGLIAGKKPGGVRSQAHYDRAGINSPSSAISLPKPLYRLGIIGRGSSAIIYKSILLKSLQLCAEKVIVVTDPSKRVQMMSELQSLKKTVVGDNKGSVNRCLNIIGLLDIVSNPINGTISICLEYMNGTYVRPYKNYISDEPHYFIICFSFSVLFFFILFYNFILLIDHFFPFFFNSYIILTFVTKYLSVTTLPINS